jgi:transcription elongation factor Elf1
MTNKVEYVDLTVNCPYCDTENTVELENNLGLITARCYKCNHLFDVVFSCSIKTMMNDIEDEQRSIEETEQSLIDEEKAAFVERWR